MNTRKHILIFCLAVCLLTLGYAAAFGQEFRGQISGRVNEASGAAVPNATVTVTNAATNSSVNATTNDSGEFTVLYLTPGNWLVELQYVGNHGYDGVVGTNILNAVPRKYLSTSAFRDQSQIDANSFLNTTVTNPFRGLIQGIGQLQGGRPITIGDVYYNGDITKLKTDVKSSNIDGTVFDISKFYFTDAAVQTNGVVDPAKQRADPRIALQSHYRSLPSRFAQFRGDNLNLWDLSVSKNVSFTETFKLQLRGEYLNAFNTPNFANPNLTPNNSLFGKITGQNNLPRNVQIGLKLVF